jgi:Icc protein
MRTDVLSWLHIGDLHIVRAGEPNHNDLRRIVALANDLPPGSLDFALLPGDNADDGTARQFALVREAVQGLGLPLHILPGDHDCKPGDLDAFYRVLGARQLPYAMTVRGHRCLFLDVVSAGSGGPDFQMDSDQLDWVERELAATSAAAVFMHTYPADLREGTERLNALLAQPNVRCVDMGHTHYNELANDGGTIFMATRSTGQIEEGPPGFSIAAVDAGCVSWRFKPLDHAWPFVLVTRPADRRLVTGANQTDGDALLVRAKVIGDAAIHAVEVSVNNGEWMAMPPVPDGTALWQARCATPAGHIRVRAMDIHGRQDEDAVELATAGGAGAQRTADGSDRNRILGTQLGPNRNGRKW